jgi:hypothetical protein
MDQSDEESAQRPAGEDGVFGNLPRSRPGTRSPLRDQPSRRGPRPSGPARERHAAPPAAAQGSPKRQRPPESAPEATPGGGLEDLAWAGITVAAEAATLGVRLVSRALGAVRDATDRE